MYLLVTIVTIYLQKQKMKAYYITKNHFTYQVLPRGALQGLSIKGLIFHHNLKEHNN